MKSVLLCLHISFPSKYCMSNVIFYKYGLSFKLIKSIPLAPPPLALTMYISRKSAPLVKVNSIYMKHKVRLRQPSYIGQSCPQSQVQYKLGPVRLSRLGNSNVLKLPVISYMTVYLSIYPINECISIMAVYLSIL